MTHEGTLLGGRGADQPVSSTPLAVRPAPPPAAVLADSVVQNLWAGLRAASAEGDSGEYDAALQRLDGIRARVSALLLSFPQQAELAAAADSTVRLADRLRSACSQLRSSMLARGREAPECAPPVE